MADEQPNWSQEWRGLEPEQPQVGRCSCWIGAFALLVALLATCLGTGYFAWRQLDLPLNPSQALARATVPPISSVSPVDSPIVGTPGSNAEATQPVLAATVTLPGSSPAVFENNSVSEVEARIMTTPPLIDGSLGDWPDVSVYESSFQVFNAEGWDGTDDIAALWRLGWDNSNLYAAVQVRDDIHVQTETGSTIFQGDGVSLQIDTQRAADLGPRLSSDDFQINLSPGDFAGNPTAAYRFRGSDNGDLLDSPGHNIQVAAQQSNDGYTLEAAIPWSDLGLSPDVGVQIGLALNVNDNDTPGTAVQEVMKSHVATRLFGDPSSWGILILR